MKERKRSRIQAAGWRVGTPQEFLGLTEQEAAFVELKHALATSLRERRQNRELTQADLAKLIGSSQPRVARMEAGDRSVTIDLLVRSLLALGTTRKELASVVEPPKRRRAA